MAFIPKALRKQITEHAKGFCEYCQASQLVIIEMEIDHIVPESAGGLTIAENLCLACVGCNHFKGNFQTGIDPQTNQIIPLFNPRTQNWVDHFRWSDNGIYLLGLTPIGRATIERLKINRELAVKARERWAKVGWHPPTL